MSESGRPLGDVLGRGDEVTITRGQKAYAGFAVTVLLYIVVLNLFVEYVDSIVIDSTAPTIANVSITPDPADASDTLTCSYDFDDPDLDADHSTIQWFIQGALVGSGPTLSGVFDRGDVVTCTVTASDGLLTGNTLSDHVTITNNLPMVSTMAT